MASPNPNEFVDDWLHCNNVPGKLVPMAPSVGESRRLSQQSAEATAPQDAIALAEPACRRAAVSLRPIRSQDLRASRISFRRFARIVFISSCCGLSRLTVHEAFG